MTGTGEEVETCGSLEVCKMAVAFADIVGLELHQSPGAVDRLLALELSRWLMKRICIFGIRRPP